ncbi:MAG: DUF4954 family protein, partial [Chitinophagaceae bacterium]|nr:DUF4954 family protein [Chitinophagaceae bacterium]
MSYRPLTTQEIELLKQQFCTAEDWSKISVATTFEPSRVYHVNFNGEIKLGDFSKEHTLPGGLKKQSGIRNACLYNCEIGNDVLIENVQNHIANYAIGNN